MRPLTLLGPIFLAAGLTHAVNSSLEYSNARRSIERAHHNRHGPRRSNGAPARRDDPITDLLNGLGNGVKEIVDGVGDGLKEVGDGVANALGADENNSSSSASSSNTATDSSTATATDSSSNTNTATATATDSGTSATETATATESGSSATATDSTTASATDSSSSAPSETNSGTSATATDPPASNTESASATVTTSDPPPSTTAPPATSTGGNLLSSIFDNLTSDLGVLTSILLPSSTPTQSDPPPTSSPEPTSSDPPNTNTVNTNTVQTSQPPPTSVSDLPTSVTDVISQTNILSSTNIINTNTVNTNTNTVNTNTFTIDTQSQSQTQTASDPPPTSGTQTGTSQIISQTNSGTNTNTGGSTTFSGPQTETVTFPTLTVTPTNTNTGVSATASSDSDSATVTSASGTVTTEPVPSFYSYLTASSLPLTNVASSTGSLTVTDPDAALTTASLTQSGTSAPLATVAIPNTLPTRIFPPDRVDPNDPTLKDYGLISFKFKTTLSWFFMVNDKEAAAMLFAFTPQMVSSAVGIPIAQIKTFALQAFAPASYTGDVNQLETVYLAFVPLSVIPTLQQMLLVSSSPLYRQEGIPGQIALQLDPTMPLDSIGLTTQVVGGGTVGGGAGSGSANEDPSASSRRDAIIGVCAAFGVILLAVVLWWAYKSWKKNKDQAHRRLTMDSAGMHQAGGYGATQTMPQGYLAAPQQLGYSDTGSPVYAYAHQQQQQPQDPFQDQNSIDDHETRRRSFFFAEDSIKGFHVPREEEQGITYTQLMRQQQGGPSNEGRRRAPIQASAISAPILRESSLNW